MSPQQTVPTLQDGILRVPFDLSCAAMLFGEKEKGILVQKYHNESLDSNYLHFICDILYL